MTPTSPPNSSNSRTYLGRHLDWAHQTLAKHEPNYRFKWDVYFERLEELAKSATRFLDAGCGDNKTVSELEGPHVCVGVDVWPHMSGPVESGVGAYSNTPLRSSAAGARYAGTVPTPAIGSWTRTDKSVRPTGESNLGRPDTPVRPFSSLLVGLRVCGRLEKLPFRDGAFDLVGCRHVVEHLDDPPCVFDELYRVMTPGGRLLIQTVNRSSALIALSRMLGTSLRRWLRRHRYGRGDADPFRLHDRFNRPFLFESPPSGFRLVSVEMTQDVDLQSRLGFWLSYLLVRWTRNRPHRRSTITAEWERV